MWMLYKFDAFIYGLVSIVYLLLEGDSDVPNARPLLHLRWRGCVDTQQYGTVSEWSYSPDY
jgi:hypothetical protein